MKSFLTCLLLLMALAGCAHRPQIPAHNMEPPGQTRVLTELLSGQYPDRFSALHRVGLNIRGKTMVLKGYLKVDRPKGEVRLIAQAGMGGTLFEVHILNGATDMISVKGGFKKSWLEKSVVNDLKHLYLLPSFTSPRAYAGRDGNIILYDSQKEKTRSYTFTPADDGGLKVSGYRQWRGSRMEYAIDYGQASPLPQFIKIQNNCLNYTLDISVRYIMSGAE